MKPSCSSGLKSQRNDTIYLNLWPTTQLTLKIMIIEVFIQVWLGNCYFEISWHIFLSRLAANDIFFFLLYCCISASTSILLPFSTPKLCLFLCQLEPSLVFLDELTSFFSLHPKTSSHNSTSAHEYWQTVDNFNVQLLPAISFEVDIDDDAYHEGPFIYCVLLLSQREIHLVGMTAHECSRYEWELWLSFLSFR